jgi:hypothetical protein
VTNLGTDGRMTLKLSSMKYGVKAWKTGYNWLRLGSMAMSYKDDNESWFHKCWGVHDLQILVNTSIQGADWHFHIILVQMVTLLSLSTLTTSVSSVKFTYNIIFLLLSNCRKLEVMDHFIFGGST